MASLPKNLHEYLETGRAHGKTLATIYRILIRSRLVVRLLFRMKVNRSRDRAGYFDASTLVLRREVRRHIRKYLYPRLLEVGIGPYALLSGSLSRRVRQRVVGCDFDEAAVASAAEHVDRNVVNVTVIRSDLLSSVPVNEYDLIYWRLPLLDDALPALNRLLGSAGNYMSSSARLVIAFNTRWLDSDAVLRTLSHSRDLQLEHHRRFWWNHREVVTIQLTQNLQRAREQQPHLA